MAERVLYSRTGCESTSDIELVDVDTTLNTDTISEEGLPYLKRVKRAVLDYIRFNYLRIIIILTIITIFSIISSIVFVVVTRTNNEKLITPEPFSMTTSDPDRTFCQKLRCLDIYCEPKEVDFQSIRKYSCCCLPSYYIYKSFEEDESNHLVSIVLQDTRLDPKNLSVYDLKLLPQLKNLIGSWHVVATSDAVYLMKYVGIRIPVEPDPDD
jgi:hypothetical protein